MPTIKPNTLAISMATSASSSVAGNKALNSSHTLRWLTTDMPKLPCNRLVT